MMHKALTTLRVTAPTVTASARALAARTATALAAMLTVATLVTSAQPARADDAATWPERTIVIINGFPAGAGTDTYSRKLGAALTERLGVPVVTDNRTGAGGNIASGVVAQSRPDGHTLLLATAGTHAINASLYRDLGFDLVEDFTPIALLGDLPNVLLVNPAKHPTLQSCADLLALARAQPGALDFASTGNGTSGHLAGAQFSSAARVQTLHVPYRGQGPAMTALLGGEIDFFFNQSTPSIAMLQSGKVRALAVTSAESVPALPGVPTVEQACDLPGFRSTTWYALYGPKGLPPAIAKKASDAVLAITGSATFRQWLDSQGITPIADAGPEALVRTQKADIARWAKVVAESGAKVD